ncbi:MAG: DUF3854 domain-containing protein [Fischerella sp. CENA71]|nr:DUF3854 domain-containing protein [Fischerella sp. CENA71]
MTFAHNINEYGTFQKSHLETEGASERPSVRAEEQIPLCPSTTLDSPHLTEWLSSAVDPELIHLNVKSLSGTAAYDYLLYSPNIKRRNDGRLRDGDLIKYRHIENGGWWCSGVDPLNDYQQMEWGCFKPNFPRRDFKKIHKIIKYEHPYREETRALFLYVTDAVWAKVSLRCGIAVSEEDKLNPRGFWHWVWKNNVPTVLCEGAKKAAALLSAGYAAIALVGVNAGYRNPKDENNKAIGKPFLIPDLEFFATLGRTFYICFDRDNKPEAVQRVQQATYTTARLLMAGDCEVKIIDLPVGGEKGVDDFIVAKGREAFDALYNTAKSLEKWQVKLYTLLTYPPAIALNQRFLGRVLVPENAKLVVIKAAKGTGKTEFLATEVAKAHERGQKVLVLTHRVQLGEALCHRFGIDYVTELKTSETGGLLGYGLCVDSMRAQSSAKFNPSDWTNAVVIIDEADQVFWHLLNSSTEVKQHRVNILRNFKQLIQNVLGSVNGKVYLSSADISDVDIKYVRSLAGFEVEPFVIVNEYQQKAGNCYVYPGRDPSELVAALIEDIRNGGVPLICCSGQKAQSRWGTQALEQMLLNYFPYKRILRIDGETVLDPTHAAFGCVAHLNQMLCEYDIVIVSPSVETGVSIDVQGHFTGVWGIASGVQPENSIRQILARLRETVPRHVWISRCGLSKSRIGNGSTSKNSLLFSQQAATRANMHLLTVVDHDCDYDFGGVDWQFQRESLNTWAAKACVINAGMARYRETILEGLALDGYCLVPIEETESASEVATEVMTVSNGLYQAECDGISVSKTYSDTEYEKSKEKRAKTKQERYRERKTELVKRYGVEVTPELVEKDDSGWYPQLRLYYYLTLGRGFVAQHDAHRAKAQAETGQEAVWQPDFNRGQLLASVRLLEELGVSVLVEPGRQYRGIDPELLRLESLAKQHKYVIKNYLGITIKDKDTPIAIAQKLLRLLGCKLTYIARLGSRGSRHMVYEFVPPDDGREEVLQVWFEREAAKAGQYVVAA